MLTKKKLYRQVEAIADAYIKELEWKDGLLEENLRLSEKNDELLGENVGLSERNDELLKENSRLSEGFGALEETITKLTWMLNDEIERNNYLERELRRHNNN